MSVYELAKTVHVGCAILSVFGFALRGWLMLGGSPLLRWLPVRIVPHVVDTLLLLSALVLLWLLQLAPWHSAWLGAKVLALLAYIGLGLVALRFGTSIKARARAYVAALACALYLFSVALTRQVEGFFGILWSIL